MKIGRPRVVNRTLITGPWIEIGHGRCMKCADERRLYAPLMKLDETVCADCSQKVVYSTLPNGDAFDRLASSGEESAEKVADPVEQPEP